MKRILFSLLLAALPLFAYGQGTIIQGITTNKAIVPVQVDVNGVVQTNNSGASVGAVTINGAPAANGGLPVYLIPFMPLGQQQTITANTSGNIPAPIQALPTTGSAFQYLIWNQGVNFANVSYATTSATATTNCIVPPSLTLPVGPGAAILITLPYSGAYFCGITASGTSIVTITPGVGG